MKIPQITIQDHIRASHVKRWHIVHTLTHQTLAEHNYNVATIALYLYNEIPVPERHDRDVEHLLCHALSHDVVEIRTGDIPTPGKALIKHFAGDSIFRVIEQNVNPHSLGGDCFIVDCVHMADLIDAAVWIMENGIGGRAEEVATKCWASMEAFVIKLNVETELDWTRPVNKVLDAMTAPHLRSELS